MKGILVVRKYKNRRLYDTERSVHITHEELLDLVRGGRDVQIQEARTGEDVTAETLLQILLTSKGQASRAMTSEFVHFLIRTDVDAAGQFFREYMPAAMKSFQAFLSGFPAPGGFPALSSFASPWLYPFGGGAPSAGPAAPPAPASSSETEQLRREMEEMQRELSRIKKSRR